MSVSALITRINEVEAKVFRLTQIEAKAKNNLDLAKERLSEAQEAKRYIVTNSVTNISLYKEVTKQISICLEALQIANTQLAEISKNKVKYQLSLNELKKQLRGKDGK